MKFKKILSVLMAAICLCSGLCFTVYAEESGTYISDEVVPAYEIAKTASSVLSISGTKATCVSSAKGDDCVGITVTHTLQKYSGWFWIWDDVEGSTSSKTSDTNEIMLSTAKSGLESGTYRLKSTFTFTSSSGSVETETVYSTEKKVG
ncbi:MAG: hypothetical protein NC203_03685 [Firmicutes bacterium]|nr:hypothetical protein [[Eubacterium] siraeum]MCM1487448.1 hypothetical protein [Bacillota bacterium]